MYLYKDTSKTVKFKEGFSLWRVKALYLLRESAMTGDEVDLETACVQDLQSISPRRPISMEEASESYRLRVGQTGTDADGAPHLSNQPNPT